MLWRLWPPGGSDLSPDREIRSDCDGGVTVVGDELVRDDAKASGVPRESFERIPHTGGLWGTMPLVPQVRDMVGRRFAGRDQSPCHRPSRSAPSFSLSLHGPSCSATSTTWMTRVSVNTTLYVTNNVRFLLLFDFAARISGISFRVSCRTRTSPLLG